jgi:Asp/Glu/hydantoin racemase
VRLLLINPNTSPSTTDTMVAIAQEAAPDGVVVLGATARRGEAMIVDAAALSASAGEVVALGVKHAACVNGIIVSAFGDPGVNELRAQLGIPVIGIAEAAMREAARWQNAAWEKAGRRFGIATVTPGLVDAINARVNSLGLAEWFTGVRLTSGDPLALVADTDRLIEALGAAVEQCALLDRAEAVVIGGGPLGSAAAALAARHTTPVIAPIPAAMRHLARELRG